MTCPAISANMQLWAVSHLAPYQPDYDSVFYAIFCVYTNHKKEPQATDVHAGTISSFDLIPNTEVISSQPPEDSLYQRAISNHFANLVCGADIAFVGTVSNKKGTAFLIFLDSKYRSFMESDDQEPFED